MGLKEHHDGVVLANFFEWRNAVACEVHAKINLTVQLKDLRLPNTMFSNSDENLSLIRLYKGHSNTSVPHFNCIVRAKVA
jgi:hypothetical protein